MDELDRIKERLPMDTYPAKEDTTTNLYKLLYSLADSIHDANTNIGLLDDDISPSIAEDEKLNMITASMNMARLNLELDSALRKRILSILMPKVGLTPIIDIMSMFTDVRPYIVETTPYTFELHISAGDPVPAEYLFGIGPGDDTWGTAIGDDQVDYAGAIYLDPESGTFVSVTYLEQLLAKIRPAGTVATIVED